ncbi:formate dehydrogenase accessory protein FdhE [Nonomuraea basaltis]|uniref:formate dehydrogenase accessory protein FdhE domain-containing protein n=1 Tax=Nonomuraea basaltis TaxID=2495887 RepID=UPI00110C6B24|nr:formate dehydrogenase accessory protein FdhE [Nonomuraea basaltis]TMR97987.1 formate dehydrogenase accessory protein FdhE [Nonomuraea basaltis]
MFARNRARAGELRERYPHAAEVLRLYMALAEVWESVGDRVPPGGPVEWAQAHVLPRVVEATARHGPPLLAAAVDTAARNGFLDAAAASGGLLGAWLADEELTPIERYLARATMRVVPLHDTRDPPRETTSEKRPPGATPGRCPACGGPPQLSYRTPSDDPLVSGRRMLECAKCGNQWNFSATTCPGCGEPGRRTLYAEPRAGPQVGRAAADAAALFPHLRAEACQTCHRYLIDVDLGRDPRAVPQVDELAAVPIDLHMADQGYTKITPNLMGF